MAAAAHPSSRESLRKLRQGHPHALDELIERWQRPLHRFAYQYVRNTSDARDLVIETFVRLYQQREKLRADSNLPAWLFTTLANLCSNQYRWKQRHPTVSLDAPLAAEDHPDTALQDRSELEPNRAMENREALLAVRAAIESLPHDLKVPLLLYHYNKLSYKEIADIVKCSTRVVETRLYRAKQRLRPLLAKYLQDGSGPLPPPLSKPAEEASAP